jgi:DNA-binding NtrC family response regulator
MRILLCDDDDCQLKFLESILVPLGHHVHSTSNGDEAWLSYQRFGPWDWVISDYLFGEGQAIKNGLYLVKAVQKLDPQQNIIVQTSEESLPLPFGVKFLHKPFLPRTLLRMMREPVQPLLPLLF